jgi:protein-S-isoprenylcysteine O-methyltransferase Ste14
VINTTALFVVVVSLFAILSCGRRWLSRKKEKGHRVFRLWVYERALLIFGGALIIRTLAPWLVVGVLRPFAAAPVGVFAESDTLRIAGLTILVAAIALQLRAQSELGANWSHAVEARIVRAGTVTTHGLYRWSRNPMYVGALAEAFALIFLLQNAAALVLLALTYRYVRANITREETQLHKLYGEAYALYCKTVPRFFWKW